MLLNAAYLIHVMAVPTPVKRDASNVLGLLFEKHWKNFYDAHYSQFEEFILSQVLNLKKDAVVAKLNDPQLAKFTDQELTKLGVKKSELAKQWSAVQLCFYLFRYGGVLGVHYPTTEQEETLEVVSGTKFAKSELESRFGRLFTDVLSGRAFKTPESLANFSTFGDCDETAFLIAQAIEAINKHSNLGLEASIIPAGVHALTGVKFKGLKKQFLMDPTFVGPEDKFPRSKIITISLGGAILGPGITEEESDKAMEDYAKKIVPRLNKRIKSETAKARVALQMLPTLENAFAFASNQPHDVLTILRHLNRCLWNEHVRDDEGERGKLVKYLALLKPEHGTLAINLAVEYVSAFFSDNKRASRFIRETFTAHELTTVEKIRLLQTIAQSIAQGKQNVDREIESFLNDRKQRVAMR